MICCPWKVGKVTVCIQRSLAAMVPPATPPLCLAGRAAEGRERAARRADRPASLPATRLPKQRAAGRGPRRRICARKRQGAHYARASREQNGARKGTWVCICAPLSCAGRALLACLLAGAIRGDAAPPRRTVSLAAACLSRPFSRRKEPQAAASSLFHPCYHLFRFPRQLPAAVPLVGRVLGILPLNG